MLLNNLNNYIYIGIYKYINIEINDLYVFSFLFMLVRIKNNSMIILHTI